MRYYVLHIRSAELDRLIIPTPGTDGGISCSLGRVLSAQILSKVLWQQVPEASFQLTTYTTIRGLEQGLLLTKQPYKDLNDRWLLK